MDAPYDISAIRRSSAEEAIIPTALLEILHEFHRQQIAYCYWKSSRRLRAVLAGEGDIDLLVARTDQHRVQLILVERDFKLFPSVGDREHPATLSFLGYDERTGQLIHIHLHFFLIVGEKFLKNYRLPWEAIFLKRAILHPTLPIQILDPASEAVLLAVRACLDLGRLDPITLRLWRTTKRKFALDRTELAARVDRALVHDLAARLLNEELAGHVADAIYREELPLTDARIRRRMRKHCAVYRSYNVVEARARSAGRSLFWLAGSMNKHLLHTPRPWNRRAPGGGCMIAMMGVDGSGKSTSVAAMQAWLSSKIDILPIYFGTGDGRPSLFFWPFKLMMPLMVRVLKSRRRNVSRRKISGGAPALPYRLLLIVWAVAVAMDKRTKLSTARRAISRGLIVLTDRFPQDQIFGFNDGPSLTRLPMVPHWLRRFESATYALARRVPPDLIIQLVVTPETAARREPSMDPETIRERIAALQRLEFPGVHVVRVDAEQPLPDVIRAVKREIWRLL